MTDNIKENEMSLLKKFLAVLFLIFSSELIIMLILEFISDKIILKTILDSALITIISYFILNYYITKNNLKFKSENKEENQNHKDNKLPIYFTIIILAVIFIAEFFIMKFLEYIPYVILPHSIIDSLSLTLIISPVIYLLLYRPLFKKNIELEESNKKVFEQSNKISNYSKNLENEVKEKTKELEEKNKELEKMNKFFIDRELKMIEQKKEIAKLKEELYKKVK